VNHQREEDEKPKPPLSLRDIVDPRLQERQGMRNGI
jgi:hypothetical protein